MKLPANLSDADQAALVAAMPATGRELVECIGFVAAIELVRVHGGRRVYIPHALAHDHPLAIVIGHAAASVLAARYGPCQLEVPALTRARLLLRDNALRAAFDEGANMDELTDRYNISERHARKVLATSTTTSPRL